MRTTVTLDKDVELLLRESMHRSRRSFKETLNAAVRAALGPKSVGGAKKPFAIKARPLGLRPGVDPAGFNKLADEFEAEGFRDQHRRSARR